jgi:hypothetical protein
MGPFPRAQVAEAPDPLLMGLYEAEKLNDQKMTENKEVWALVVSFKHPWY